MRIRAISMVAGVGSIALALISACVPIPAHVQTIQTAAFRLHYNADASSPRPLVIILGATGRTQAQIMQMQDQDGLAEQQGYVAAYVQAPGDSNTWWTGPDSSCVPAFDGAAYLRQQVGVMRALLPTIDVHRMYIEGWSNGGFMAVYALTKAPDLFAAGGEIESVLDLPAGSRAPIRVKHVHALGDTVVPIDGGGSPLLEAACGHHVDIPSSYRELSTLPLGSVDSLTIDAGSGPGLHDYQPSAATTFWNFMRVYRR